MDVFVTGGSGYIGRPTIEALVRAGHRVSALARSEASRSIVAGLGATPVAGDLSSLGVLRSAAEDADAVINLAQDNAGDTAALTAAAADVLVSSARVYVHTGGTWAYGNATSDDAQFDPPPLLAWFVEIVSRVVERGAVAVMPGIVYGRGGGILEPLMGARYIGAGSNRMPLVHVDDVADLYVRALDAAPGSVLIAAGPDAPPMRDVAAWFGEPVSVSLEEFGPFGEAFALDQRFTSTRAREELGWAPRALAPARAGIGTAR